MISAHSDITTELVKEEFSFVVLYEIELDASTLYFSSQAVTWGGNAYTALAVKSSSIRESMKANEIPSLSVTFSNVDNDLRSYIEPTDQLTGRRLTARLIVRNGVGGAFKSNSMVLFVGIIEQPDAASQKDITLRAVGLIDGKDIPVPSRRTSSWCPWRFKDGINCNYAGGLTCDREYSTCETLGQTEDFGGFLAVADLFSQHMYDLIHGIYRFAITTWGTSGWDLEGMEGWWRASSDLANAKTPVPLALGRKLIPGTMIEEHIDPGYLLSDPRKVSFRMLSHGEIEEVVNWYGDDGELGEDTDESGERVLGFFWRAGGAGVDADESAYATTELAQNRDGYSWGGQTYARTAYALFIQPTEDDFEEITSVLFDVKGIKFQKYTAGGSPDGSPVYTEDPIWQAVGVCLSKDYGLGQIISSSDIDFSSVIAAAAVCDAVIASVEASTTISEASGGASTTYKLDNAFGFIRGMNIKVNGVSAGEIVSVLDRVTIETDTALDSLVGQTVIGQVPRFTSNGLIAESARASRVIADILKTCAGYVTYAEGKIQFHVEQADTSVASFKDTGAAQGYGIVRDSFRWLAGNKDREINRMIVEFDNASLDKGADEVAASDWDSIEATQLRERSEKIGLVNTGDQAGRLSALKLAKCRTLDSGATLAVGPIGVVNQPGDVIDITHTIPNWAGKDVRITKREIIGLGSKDELCVRLTVEDYDASIYVDTTGRKPPRRIGPLTYPTITLSLEADQDGRIVLTWELSTGGAGHYRAFTVHKSTSSGFTPSFRNRISRRSITRNRFVYTPHEDEIGQTLYFKVRGVSIRTRIPVNSNEESAIPAMHDPSDTQNSSPFNMVFDGDFSNEGNWELTAATGTETKVLPNANSADPDSDGALTDPAEAYDGDDDDFAHATSTTTLSYGSIYSFASATKSGRIRCLVEVATTVGVFFRGNLAYSIDGGTTWVTFSRPTEYGGKDYVYSEDLGSVNLANLQVRCVAPAGARAQGTLKVYECAFLEATDVPPYARIENSILTLVGVSSSSSEAEASRPFPGFAPEGSEIAFISGAEATIRVAARNAGNGDPNEVVTIGLEEEEGGSFHTLLTLNDGGNDTSLASADGGDDWRHFSALYAPTKDIAGPLRVVIKTETDNGVQIDKLQITRGPYIWEWNPAIEEMHQGSHGDRSTGVPSGFGRGRWTTGLVRKSTVSGAKK